MTVLDFTDRLGIKLSRLKRTLLKAVYHLPMTAGERAAFREHAGRAYRRGETWQEITLLVGRRGGKSLLAGIVALFELLRPETRAALSPGEAAVVPIISRTRDTARTVFEPIEYQARTNPVLAPLCRNILAGSSYREIEFRYDDRNPLFLRVMPARHWAVLGRAVPAGVLDEFCWFPTEGASTDRDIVEALEPSLAQFGDHGKVLQISSPWIKAGLAYERWKERATLRHGFVFTATSREFNPLTLSARFLARQRAKDPVAFARNFLAEFSDAIDAFIPAATVDACVERGRRQVPWQTGVRCRGFLDAAYKRDRFVFLIASRHENRMRIDVLRRWYPPVRLPVVLAEIRQLAREYHLAHEVDGDQYGSAPLRELLQRECGLGYREVTLTVQSKVQIFGTLKGLFTQERIELLDEPETLRELRALEARVTPAGNVQIGHPAGGGFHDDAAVTLALAAHRLMGDPTGAEGHIEMLKRQLARMKEREKGVVPDSQVGAAAA